MGKGAVYLGLGLSAMLAILAASVAIYFSGFHESGAWAVVAAALSVVVATLSAWSTERLLHVQEEEQQPFIRLVLDVVDLAGGKTLRAINIGRTTAHTIAIRWDEPATPKGSGILEHRANRLHPSEPVEWRLPKYFQSTSQFKANVTWHNSRGRRFEDTFLTTDDDLTATTYAKIREGEKSVSEWRWLRREVAEVRKLLTAIATGRR